MRAKQMVIYVILYVIILKTGASQDRESKNLIIVNTYIKSWNNRVL